MGLPERPKDILDLIVDDLNDVLKLSPSIETNWDDDTLESVFKQASNLIRCGDRLKLETVNYLLELGFELPIDVIEFSKNIDKLETEEIPKREKSYCIPRSYTKDKFTDVYIKVGVLVESGMSVIDSADTIAHELDMKPATVRMQYYKMKNYYKDKSLKDVKEEFDGVVG